MAKTFLSYSEPDSEKVKIIKKQLINSEIELYDFDDKRFTPGIIIKEIEQNISESEFTICFLSKSWLESAWCQQEWTIFFHMNIDTVHEKLILIELEELDPKTIPPSLAPLRRIAFSYNIKQLDYLIQLIKGASDSSPPFNLAPDKLKQIQYIFVVGAPAAGKSTVSQLIAGHFFSMGISVRLENDYAYLQHLYRKEKAKGEFVKFAESEESEFIVKDPSVFDDVLYLIYRKMVKKPVRTGEVRIIEFSRKYYDASFLKYTINAMFNSVIIHMDTPLNICRLRNHERKRELDSVFENFDASAQGIHFDGDPNLHFTPPEVFDEYAEAEKSVTDQSLVLSLMPARAYIQIDNTGDKNNLEESVSDLFKDLLLKLVSEPESLESYYKRRITRLKDLFNV